MVAFLLWESNTVKARQLDQYHNAPDPTIATGSKCKIASGDPFPWHCTWLVPTIGNDCPIQTYYPCSVLLEAVCSLIGDVEGLERIRNGEDYVTIVAATGRIEWQWHAAEQSGWEQSQPFDHVSLRDCRVEDKARRAAVVVYD